MSQETSAKDNSRLQNVIIKHRSACKEGRSKFCKMQEDGCFACPWGCRDLVELAPRSQVVELGDASQNTGQIAW